LLYDRGKKKRGSTFLLKKSKARGYKVSNTEALLGLRPTVLPTHSILYKGVRTLYF
jgi:hypothetical protein